jgi:hypothetical protein
MTSLLNYLRSRGGNTSTFVKTTPRFPRPHNPNINRALGLKRKRNSVNNRGSKKQKVSHIKNHRYGFAGHSNARTIQKHVRGMLARKTLRNLRNAEDPVTLNVLRGNKVYRVRRAPGIHNYFNMNTLNKIYNATGKVTHPLTRKNLTMGNVREINNPYAKGR